MLVDIKLLKTSQQRISRLESTGYEGHSLSMLRRVAEALHARVRVVFEPDEAGLSIVDSSGWGDRTVGKLKGY